ncbi:Cyanovirin-N [Penicillium sp. IBT 16267x]|nr:Cyanovirin-N [Penicillium sp. IBT 16267x]
MPGNWQENAVDATIAHRNGHTVLMAWCRDGRGDVRQSQLDLDEHIGDMQNKFSWFRSGFTRDALQDSIRFDFREGASQQPVLRARFAPNAPEADINTAEHIRNNNGQLEFDL